MNEEPKQRTALARHLDKWAMFLWREDTPGFGGWDVAKWYAQQADLHDRLVSMLEEAEEWLDQVCDPQCEDLRTPEGLEFYGRFAALLKEARGETDG